MLPIAIIEDQPELRAALADYLCQQPEFRCVLVVGSVEEFLAGASAVNPTPQLILSDIGLPGRSGIEGLPLIRQRLPQAQVIMLSVFNDAERVVAALRAGAVGYLEKDTLPAQVKEALLQVAAGGSPMSPGVARQVVRFFQPAPSQQPQEALTPREQEVVRAIEDGLSYKLVAKRLFISVDTVRAHIRSVYRKLEVNSKADILRRAGRQGPA
ncbi:response regulator transcription factor [Hymenobacter sp. ASUV-10]|uniref:Response regulator transcription factor n=1 Tax=Hymenobacter aranciens TaxID=3063996 RepID=A0ABT9BHL5_9BACT|nr:response regulator transcription factor [Hymenobacter sp. ASUV-10]MDO7877163.1 response regulator transcription factor [Hymenobacter sp. ASUV-10]